MLSEFCKKFTLKRNEIIQNSLIELWTPVLIYLLSTIISSLNWLECNVKC